MQFNKRYIQYLKESSAWIDSGIEIKSKPLKAFLVKNNNMTANYGFVLFSEDDDTLDVIPSLLPRRIVSREGAKEFALKLNEELNPPKPIRGKLINMVNDLRFYLEYFLDVKIEERKFVPNTTQVTPFKCKECGYRHSDEITEVPKSDGGTTWQRGGEVYCSRCGKEVEHVNVEDERRKLKDK